MAKSHDFRQQNPRGYLEASEICRYCGEQKTAAGDPCPGRVSAWQQARWGATPPPKPSDYTTPVSAAPQPQTYTDFQVQKLVNGLKWIAGIFAVICIAVWAVSCTAGHDHKLRNGFGFEVGTCEHSHPMSPFDISLLGGHGHDTLGDCD